MQLGYIGLVWPHSQQFSSQKPVWSALVGILFWCELDLSRMCFSCSLILNYLHLHGEVIEERTWDVSLLLLLDWGDKFCCCCCGDGEGCCGGWEFGVLGWSEGGCPEEGGACDEVGCGVEPGGSCCCCCWEPPLICCCCCCIKDWL